MVNDIRAGPTSHAVLSWDQDMAVEGHYIALGEPQRNGLIESLDGRLSGGWNQQKAGSFAGALRIKDEAVKA